MDDARCAHGGLQPGERTGRRCPRCRADVDTPAVAEEPQAPYRPPSASLETARSSSWFTGDCEETFSPGARIAGVILILNAVSALYAGVVLQIPLTGPSPAGSAIVDAILGSLLVLGQRKVVPFCIVRVLLGALLVLGLSLYSGGAATAAVMQLALSGALLGLLWRRPGSARLAFSTVVATASVLLAAFVLHTGARIWGAEELLAANEIEVITGGNVRGVAYPYRFEAPNPRWYIRRREVVKRENPVADQWLIRPDKGAHFIVVVETLSGERVDVGDYQNAVLESLENAATRVEVLDTGSLSEEYEQSRRFRARAVVRGLPIDYTYGLVVFNGRGYRFIGFAGQGEFPSVAPEFQQMFDTLVIGE